MKTKKLLIKCEVFLLENKKFLPYSPELSNEFVEIINAIEAKLAEKAGKKAKEQPEKLKEDKACKDCKYYHTMANTEPCINCFWLTAT